MSHSLCCEWFKKEQLALTDGTENLTIKPPLYQVDCWIMEMLLVAVTILQFNRLKDCK